MTTSIDELKKLQTKIKLKQLVILNVLFERSLLVHGFTKFVNMVDYSVSMLGVRVILCELHIADFL